MNQLHQLYERLSLKQRIWIAAAIVAVVGGLVTLQHWNQERDYKPLLTGLAPEDAGTVTAKLKELNADYRLSDNGATILVPSAKLAELRLQLASSGLPKTGRIGFELFDKANFGASEFAEQVNFNRAMEGELERSVMSIREVETARVHITPAKDSIYTEQRQPAKASVLVKLRRAAALSPQNIQAICQLLGSAVPGLAPEMVTLVDTAGNLLNRSRQAGIGVESSEATLDYRKSIERDLQNKIAATLEPLLGVDHFRVGVSAEVDLSTTDQNEETYDPQKSSVTNSQKTEDGPGLNTTAGVPGTASNLPRPTAASSSAAAGASGYSRKTENISYQPSRVIKHVRLPQGTVKRLSLSVLVDHNLRWEGQKRIVEPPTQERLKVIRDLVAAATGFDSTRGDQMAVEALAFEATLTAEPVTASPLQADRGPQTGMKLPAWLQTLIENPRFKLIVSLAGGLVIALAAAVMAWRRKTIAKQKVKAEATTAGAVTAGGHHPVGDQPVTREEIERQIQERLEQHSAEISRKEAEALMNLQMPEVETKKAEVLQKHIASEAKRDPAALAQVIRTWLDGDKRTR